MLEYLNKRSTKLEWVGGQPDQCRRQALLIPLYNEADSKFENRLDYFNKFGIEFGNEIDVIIINDGSTDDSLDRIKNYQIINSKGFFVASVYPNANKVGALFMTILSISHELVILSDFDTEIIGIRKLLETSDYLMNNTFLMGCYFRMLPFEGSGNIFLFQQLEYSMARTLYKFHLKDGSVPVMPGAGSCYKRDVLISIYNGHSGLRNGEDREATMLGLKMGYKAFYMNNTIALTRPPLSFKSLIIQRKRWNLGYLETFHKERRYYLSQILNRSSLGLVALRNVFTTLFLALLPIFVLLIGVFNFYILLFILIVVYVISIIWCLKLLFSNLNESTEFKRKRLLSVFIFPLYKLPVECCAWMAAFWTFGRRWLSIKLNRNIQ